MKFTDVAAWPARVPGKFIAAYRVSEHYWKMALNALGAPILCDSPELALSVARYRRARYEPLEG
jgi:hypothetical protein